MKRPALLSLLAPVAAAVALAGCGSTHYVSTPFATHAGLADGAFHQFINKPFKAGDLSASHTSTVATAEKAAAYIESELKAAASAAKSSSKLSSLESTLDSAAQTAGSLKSSLAGGHVTGSDVDTLKSAMKSLQKSAKSKGQAFKPKTPSSSQL